MKIATIVPVAHLNLERFSDYHLCLAHIADHNSTYFGFYRSQAMLAHYVMLDNGAAENGQSMPIFDLMSIAISMRCSELILPDVINDREETLKRSKEGMNEIVEAMLSVKMMTVPQGKDQGEWIACVREMLEWEDVNTIGISKFVMKMFSSRLAALDAVPELIASKKEIHLLGYTGVRSEIIDIIAKYGDRIRGVDSSIATLYAQRGQEMPLDGRPEGEALDLGAILNETLLKKNIETWRSVCQLT